MAYSAFWLSSMGLLVKVAGQRLPSMEIVFVRGVITLLLSWFLLVREGIDPWKGPHKLLVLRGVLGAAALTCFYFSLVHLPLAEATVFQYMNPLLVSAFAATFLGERSGKREWTAICISLVGVLLIARPAFLFGGSKSLPLFFVVVSLAGSLFSSLAYITVRHLRHQHNALLVVFYFPLVTVPLSLPFALPAWVPPTAMEWLLLLGVGVTTQIGQVYLTRGLQLEPAARATAIGYLQIIFATVWGYLIFQQLPHLLGVGGALLIVVSTLWVVSFGKLLPEKPSLVPVEQRPTPRAPT
jgi:drug/metabolite transporter (DMT)-like permease